MATSYLLFKFTLLVQICLLEWEYVQIINKMDLVMSGVLKTEKITKILINEIDFFLYYNFEMRKSC